MPLVHYNAITRTACWLRKGNVYVTNRIEDVNCDKCKKVIGANKKKADGNNSFQA